MGTLPCVFMDFDATSCGVGVKKNTNGMRFS